MSTFGRKSFENYYLAFMLILVFIQTKVNAETQAEYQAREQEALNGNPEHLEQWYNDNPAPSFQQPTTSSAPVGSVSNPSTQDPFSTPAPYDPSDVANPANPDSPYYSGASNNTSPVGSVSNPSTEDPFNSSTAYDPNDVADPNNPASPYYSGDNPQGTSPSETASTTTGQDTGSGGSTGTGSGGPVDNPEQTVANLKTELNKCKTKSCRDAITQLIKGVEANASVPAASVGGVAQGAAGMGNGGTNGSTVAGGGATTSTTATAGAGASAGNTETSIKNADAIKNGISSEALNLAGGNVAAANQIIENDGAAVNAAAKLAKTQGIGQINAQKDLAASGESIKNYGNAISGSSGSGLTGAGGSTGSSLAGSSAGSTGSSLAGGARNPASNSGGFFSTTTGKVVGAVAAGGLAYGVVSAMQDDDDDSSSSGNSGSSGSSSGTCSHGKGTKDNCTSCDDGYELSNKKCVAVEAE